MPDLTPVLFGEWLPDQGLVGNPGSAEIKNCIPTPSGYRPMPGRILRSLTDAGAISGLDARCQGAITFHNAEGDWAQVGNGLTITGAGDPALAALSSTRVAFMDGTLDSLRTYDFSAAGTYTIAGDATKLYRITDETGTTSGFRDWTDVSQAGGYSVNAEHQWDAAITILVNSVNSVVFTNINDEVQYAGVSASEFVDLITSTLKPRAAHLCVTTNFLVLASMIEIGVEYRKRVRWSAFESIRDFDQSATTQSDAQDVEGDGDIQRLVAFGRDFYVFQEYGITVARYEGTPTIFRFDLVEKNIGVVSPGSVVSYGRFVFFLSHDGFKMFDGAQVHHIGKEKADRWAFDHVTVSQFNRISAAIDPRRGIVVWNLPFANTSRQLAYSFVTQRWTYCDAFNLEFIFSDLSKGYELEDLQLHGDLEDLPASLDSIVWVRGFPVMGSFDAANHALYSHDGSPIDATLETLEQEHNPGYLTFVDIVKPLYDGEVDPGDISVAVGTRDLGSETRTFAAQVGLNSIDEADVRSAARRHTYRVTFANGFDHALGVAVQQRQWGRQ